MTEIQGLKSENLIQISMDGPNVNLAVDKNVEAERDAAGLPQLINDVSSCSLHGAFKFGTEATL